MKDQAGEVIYVGKAKNLRSRVRSYFRGGDGRFQISFLMRRVQEIDTIVTDTEEQAFLLERDLITKYKPRYNIRLKDDKAYLNIRIDLNQAWPRLELVRKIEQDGAKYFGPYTFSHELKSVLDLIKKIVPLRTCSNTVFYNRQRPCLEYQIKRCPGPCCLQVDPELYQDYLAQAIAILEGDTRQIAHELERLMQQASESLRFEDAAEYRDKLEMLENFGRGLQYVSTGGEQRDVFALYREERLAVLSVLNVRSGRISDNKNYSFSQVEISDQEILESALEQYYGGGREIPEEIVLPFELEDLSFLKESLQKIRGSKVDFSSPKRGIRSRLLGLAELNAKQYFMSSFDAEARYTEISTALAKLFKLKQIPRRIECLDISNFQGSDIVGAIVSFFDGAADKKNYKKYIISRQGKPDDFGSIHEVVTRRLKRAQASDDFPDLLIIDGGPGQLSSALAARDELGLELEIISIAKMRKEAGSSAREMKGKPERIYIEGSPEAIILEPGEQSTHFLQRVRDEVHRFVIGFHRKRRAQRATRSVLDDIPGIGPERRRRLLRAFQSVENMKSVSAEDLAREGRMSKALAEKLLRVLKS